MGFNFRVVFANMCASECIWTVISRLCRYSDSQRWSHKDNGKFLAVSADLYPDSGRNIVILEINGVVQMEMQ